MPRPVGHAVERGGGLALIGREVREEARRIAVTGDGRAIVGAQPLQQQQRRADADVFVAQQINRGAGLDQQKDLRGVALGGEIIDGAARRHPRRR